MCVLHNLSLITSLIAFAFRFVTDDVHKKIIYDMFSATLFTISSFLFDIQCIRHRDYIHLIKGRIYDRRVKRNALSRRLYVYSLLCHLTFKYGMLFPRITNFHGTRLSTRTHWLLYWRVFIDSHASLLVGTALGNPHSIVRAHNNNGPDIYPRFYSARTSPADCQLRFKRGRRTCIYSTIIVYGLTSRVRCSN